MVRTYIGHILRHQREIKLKDKMEPNHRRMCIFNWNNFCHGSNKNKCCEKDGLEKTRTKVRDTEKEI